MTARITGVPLGRAPRFAPPADRSALFGSHSQEAARLRRQADEADWHGDADTAKRLYEQAAHHRDEAATCDLMPLF